MKLKIAAALRGKHSMRRLLELLKYWPFLAFVPTLLAPWPVVAGCLIYLAVTFQSQSGKVAIWLQVANLVSLELAMAVLLLNYGHTTAQVIQGH